MIEDERDRAMFLLMLRPDADRRSGWSANERSIFWMKTIAHCGAWQRLTRTRVYLHGGGASLAVLSGGASRGECEPFSSVNLEQGLSTTIIHNRLLKISSAGGHPDHGSSPAPFLCQRSVECGCTDYEHSKLMDIAGIESTHRPMSRPMTARCARIFAACAKLESWS